MSTNLKPMLNLYINVVLFYSNSPGSMKKKKILFPFTDTLNLDNEHFMVTVSTLIYIHVSKTYYPLRL